MAECTHRFPAVPLYSNTFVDQRAQPRAIAALVVFGKLTFHFSSTVGTDALAHYEVFYIHFDFRQLYY